MWAAIGCDQSRATEDGRVQVTQRVLSNDDYRQVTQQFEKVRVYGNGDDDIIDLVGAVVDEGHTERPLEGPAAEFAAVAWLFDFAELQTRDEPADPKTVEAIDVVISAYWD